MNRAMAASKSSRVQSPRMMTFTVLFTRSFTGGREEVFDRACDENDRRSKNDLGQKHQIGRERPHFFGSLPPKCQRVAPALTQAPSNTLGMSRVFEITW